MAQRTTKNEFGGFVDKRWVQSDVTPKVSTTFMQQSADVQACRTRLAAISAATYTAARLDSMTLNDMLYAIRLNDEAGSI